VAHHKDAIKRNKQNIQRRARNRHLRSQMRNQIKFVRDAVEDNDLPDAQKELRAAVSIIQSVASKGVIHRNQAARRISRLNAVVKALQLAQAQEA